MTINTRRQADQKLQNNDTVNQSSEISVDLVRGDTRSVQSEVNSLSPVVSNCDFNNTIELTGRRWAILFAICVFGINSGLTGEFGSILNTVLKLLDLTVEKYVYISQIFLYLPLFLTVPTAWLIDQYGIKMAMYGATAIMFIRNLFRALLFNPDLPKWEEFKLTYWIISCMAGLQTITIFYCVPLKVSENWFPVSEKTIAWTVMITSSSIGSSLSSFLLPRLVHKVEDIKPMSYLNLGGAVVTAIVVFSCVTRSRPRHPPSERMVKTGTRSIPYKKSIKKMFRHKNIMIQMVHEAIHEGMFIAVFTVIQDILLASNYSRIFVGNLMAINLVTSTAMTIGLATFVHRVSDITLACKLASLARSLVFTAFLATLIYPVPEWVIITVSIIYHICASWTGPNFNNMIAYLASGTVSEATIAGFSVTITLLIMTVSNVMFISLKATTSAGSDYKPSILFSSIVVLVNTIMYLLFFDGRATKEAEETLVEPSLDSTLNRA